MISRIENGFFVISYVRTRDCLERVARDWSQIQSNIVFVIWPKHKPTTLRSCRDVSALVINHCQVYLSKVRGCRFGSIHSGSGAFNQRLCNSI